jgi:hypothetical protein
MHLGKEKSESLPHWTPRKKPTLRNEAEAGERVEVVGAVEALRQMNPADWRGKSMGGDCGYEKWFVFVSAVKSTGVGREDFIKWSTQDPRYAAHRKSIGRIWDSASGRHGGMFFKALSERGIKLSPNTIAKRGLFPKGSHGGSLKPSPTIDVRDRTRGLVARLKREPSDDRLFSVAATFGEIILEKRIQRWVANDMLEGACQANGLWKLLGPDRCRRTIANAFRHVEEKFLGER